VCLDIHLGQRQYYKQSVLSYISVKDNVTLLRISKQYGFVNQFEFKDITNCVYDCLLNESIHVIYKGVQTAQ